MRRLHRGTRANTNHVIAPVRWVVAKQLIEALLRAVVEGIELRKGARVEVARNTDVSAV